MEGSKDDKPGKYKNCDNCSGPNIQTYYNFILYGLDAGAYDVLSPETNDLSDRLFFLDNFKGSQFYPQTERNVCSTINVWATEHEQKAKEYDRRARQASSKAILASATIVPGSLVLAIVLFSRGIHTTNTTAAVFNPILAGGLGAVTILSGIRAGENFNEADSYNSRAQEERNIAYKIRLLHACAGR